MALSDLARRLGAALDGALGATEWWPAPELTDWLYAPISGADAGYARAFDKKVRSSRALGVEGVLRELQSVQSRAAAARRKLPAGSVMAGVPVVCSDVMQLLIQQRPVSALKAMLSAVVALPASAFGSVDGAARQPAERMVAERAIEVLMEEARRLDVSQAVVDLGQAGEAAVVGLVEEVPLPLHEGSHALGALGGEDGGVGDAPDGAAPEVGVLALDAA